MDELKIVNIVASGKFDREFDLKELAKTLDKISGIDANHDFESNSLYIDFEKREALCILYMSGSYSIRGGTSLCGVEGTQEDLENVLEEVEIETKHKAAFEIKNIVCIGELEKEFVLGDIQESDLPGRAEFEPEQFPGLIYRDPDTSGTVLIFSNGKLNITGLRTIESINQLYNTIKTKIGG